ncbi:MAG: hypothetical protein HDR52_00410 [Treponema sp.]|nr:hypothetical protein [Treponema sp.]
MKKMFKKLQRGVLFAATTFMLVTFTLSTLVACSSDSENESDMGVEETYMVTFNSNGGSEVEAQIVVSGEKAEEPTEPTKDGFLFTGWRDKNGSFFNFDTPIRSNITLTAGWERTTVPSEPQNVTAKASGFRCIDVSWDAVDDADSYIVYFRLSLEDGEEDSQETGTEATRKTTNTRITIDYLNEDKKYDFWVIAKNSIGDSGRSDVVSARQYFPAPTSVHADVSGKGFAHLSWSSVRGATGYEIYAQRDEWSFSSEKVFLKSSVDNWATIGGLASGGHYYFYVKAVCGTKTSDYSSKSDWTLIH